MTASLAGHPLNAGQLQLAGHLAECEQNSGDWRSCQWCLWAIDTPEVRIRQNLIADADALLNATEQDAVPWVIAAVELERGSSRFG